MGRGRRWAVLAALVALCVCAPARADIPGALTLSAPLSDEQAVALDDHGNASFAWRTSPAGQDTQIHFCRLLAGASACAPDTTAPLQHGGYVPAAILEDATDGSQVRMVVETTATDQQFNGQTVVFASGDGGATYSAPVASGGGDLILPSVTVGGPGAFSWSSLAFGSFLSGPLDGSSTTQPVNLAPDGPNDNEEPMGIGFPDPTTPLAVWYHAHFDNGNTVKTITYRHWLGTGSVNDPSTWGPVRDFTPPDGIQSSEPTAVASGPKGVFALYAPEKAPAGKCGRRPELVRYNAAADTWGPPLPIDDDPHTGLSSACGYDNGGSGTAFSISQDGQGVLHALYTFHSGRPFADQTVPQGLLYSVSSDGGQTWAKPVSIANTNQIVSDGSFHVAVNTSGEAILTWRHSTGSANTGDVIQALRLPPLSAVKPGGPAGGPCPALITVGKTKLLATQGCWAKSGKRYTATGAVRIDGIDLLPKGGSAARAAAAASVSVDTATRILKSAGDYQTKIGSVDLGSKPVDWQLPAQAGQLLDAASGDPVQLAITKGQTVLGLPVAGIVTPSFGANGLASIPLNLELPAPLDGVLGGGLTDDVTFTSDVTRGLHLDRGSIAIDLPEVDLGVARIHPFHVDYNADPFVFEADLGLELPGGFGALEGSLMIQNGELVNMTGAYTPPTPGIAVASGVFLTQVSFGIHKGQSCQPSDQTAINIGANLSGGGDIGGVSLLAIDGSAIFKLPSSSCHLPAVFRIDGDGKLVGLGVAHVYFQYTTPALLEFGAKLSLGDDSTGLSASVDGGINAENGHFFIEGKGHLAVLDYDIASIDVIGSNIGLGACAKLNLLPGIPFLPTTINAGGYILWDDLNLVILKSGCDVSFLKPKDFKGARASAVGPQTFTVKPGTPSQTFLAFGHTKAPSFVLKSPSGATYTSPTAQQQQTTDGPAEGLTLDSNKEASILVHKPASGTWTVTPQGDEPVDEIRTAAGVVMPRRVTGVVRSGGKRRFSLAYKVAGASPDVAVDVFERGRGAQRAIGQLKGSRGVLHFTAAPGPGGRREIIAVPHGVGAPPTRSSVIAHYVAPKPAAPPAPRHVGLVRGRGAERVSWSPSPGAKRYVVRATLRDGRRQEIPVKASRRFVVLQHVPGPDAGTIRVYAIGPDQLVSKPAIAKLKAVHVHRHKSTKKKRRTRA